MENLISRKEQHEFVPSGVFAGPDKPENETCWQPVVGGTNGSDLSRVIEVCGMTRYSLAAHGDPVHEVVAGVLAQMVNAYGFVTPPSVSVRIVELLREQGLVVQ